MLYSKKNSPILLLAKVLLLFFLFSNSCELFAQDISVVVTDGNVREQGSNRGRFRVFLTPGSFAPADITVDYTITGIATGGVDYNELPGSVVIASGNNGVFINVDGIIDDDIVEGDESVTITLDLATGVPINPNGDTATLTITDNDIGIISMDNFSPAFVDEATEGGANGNFRLILDKGKGIGVPLNVSFTLSGTATNAGPEDDFDLFNVAVNAAQNMVVFQDDLFIMFRQIDLEAFADASIEGNETVTMTLTGTDNPLFEIDPLNNTGTVTIIDATAAAGINVDPTTGTTTEAGGTADFIFSLTSQPTAPVTIPLNNTQPLEGSVQPEVVLDATNFTGVTVTVTGLDDDILDGDVTYTIGTQNPSSADPNYNALTGADVAQIVVTNLDDDQQISISNRVVNEGDSGITNLNFTVRTASGDPAVGDIEFAYSTMDNSAIAGQDYVAVASGTGVILDGATTTTIPVEVIGDLDLEQNENFRVNLSDVTNGAILDGLGVGFILNDDGDVISINDVAMEEGNSGPTEFVFTVSLNGDGVATSDIDFDFSTADDTLANPATADEDYMSITGGSGTINAGETSTDITVIVNGGPTPEPNETFRVVISGTTNATISDAIGRGTIINDDTSIVSIDNPASVAEGNTGTAQIAFAIAINLADPINDVTVDYTISGGNENGTTGTLTFPAGTTTLSQNVIVTTNGDTIVENDENISVTLSNPSSNASLGANSTGSSSFIDDDIASVRIENVSGTEDAGPIVVTAILDNAVNGGFTVQISTSDGTATLADDDYDQISNQALVFAGTANESRQFNLIPTADNKIEPDETVNILMSNLSGTSSTVDISDTAIIIIQNDDNCAAGTSAPLLDTTEPTVFCDSFNENLDDFIANSPPMNSD